MGVGALLACGPMTLAVVPDQEGGPFSVGVRSGGWFRFRTETVRAFAEFGPRYFALPHPSWRSKLWMKRNPWFASDVLPALRDRVAALRG